MNAHRLSTALAACAAAAVGVATAVVAVAQAGKPYASGNAAAGMVLADKACNACHARLHDGNATRIYTRPDRRVKTPSQLAAQVAYCNTQLGLSYFPEEEADLALYLDREYYRFP
ncbi:MAG: cytochrome c [Burkholderiales bacterium]|nr:cytochrome c [Burkholderiales bacterium]MCE7878525.1 cytochrome c [Betaproteobacteria bacterium PRO3]